MSKIEEALKKANILRESYGNTGNVKAHIPSDGEIIKTDNQYLVTLTQPGSPVAEEYRRLKSMLIRETKANFLNTVMITSAVEAEGKSLTAVNLALTLSQEIDHTILLVDADLRKPTLHEYLGISCKYGLSDYLTRDIDLSEILVKTGIGNLLIIPAGHTVENPVELLSSVRMKTLIHELKHRYMDRYVIIDTPPILPFADAISLGSLVDGVLFIVKEGRIQKKSLENAVHLIKDLKILGVVFNYAHAENLEGHYSRYYYYNYKKKEKK
ncbi:MAG: polysaccharide biosynthesis tyrosine autokinase [Nitrospiraceae bacterium]|nr:MAG: polysaccharide biosynthesis tyrosine autokinase [Nitrospiraceae bacterium]